MHKFTAPNSFLSNRLHNVYCRTEIFSYWNRVETVLFFWIQYDSIKAERICNDFVWNEIFLNLLFVSLLKQQIWVCYLFRAFTRFHHEWIRGRWRMMSSTYDHAIEIGHQNYWMTNINFTSIMRLTISKCKIEWAIFWGKWNCFLKKCEAS